MTGTVTVGPEEMLGGDDVLTGSPTWSGPAPGLPASMGVQLRAHGDELAGVVEGDSTALTVTFGDERPRGIAPGQTAAFYDGTRVVGSATIAATRC